MKTETETETETRTESPDLYYFYKVRDLDDNIWSVSTEAELIGFSKDPNIEILRGYITGAVRVDGVWYRRNNRNVIATPAFFTVKPDYTGLEDRYVPWETIHERLHKCRKCGRDWEMDENRFLWAGEINCNHCGARGSTGSSFW